MQRGPLMGSLKTDADAVPCLSPVDLRFFSRYYLFTTSPAGYAACHDTKTCGSHKKQRKQKLLGSGLSYHGAHHTKHCGCWSSRTPARWLATSNRGRCLPSPHLLALLTRPLTSRLTARPAGNSSPYVLSVAHHQSPGALD
jgi:hypothetical protein